MNVGLPSVPRVLGPKPTFVANHMDEDVEGERISSRRKSEGAIRIPLHALTFLFNDLAFPGIPCRSLKFHSSLFSIPTAQATFLLTHCAASTVSLNPIALVTATSVDRRGLPWTDNVR